MASYTQVRFLLHSYRALSRWWLSSSFSRFEFGSTWRYAVQVDRRPTSPSSWPEQERTGRRLALERHGALPSAFRASFLRLCAPVQPRPQCARTTSASSRRYGRRTRSADDAQQHMRDKSSLCPCRQSAPLKSLRKKMIALVESGSPPHTVTPATRFGRRTFLWSQPHVEDSRRRRKMTGPFLNPKDWFPAPPSAQVTGTFVVCQVQPFDLTTRTPSELRKSAG